jgi:hypothetical protein
VFGTLEGIKKSVTLFKVTKNTSFYQRHFAVFVTETKYSTYTEKAECIHVYLILNRKEKK